tara:strand:+ start:156 stop:599 length:444 start_codon:yes stop_codon:yes gene_type:complete
VEDVMVVGVPEMAPVDVLKERPLGSDGEIDHEVTAPPLALGVAVVMAESLVNVNGLPLYTMDDGAISLTVMVTVAVELPPELLAVTVYCVWDETAVGVPEMAPVELENRRPAGSVGEIDQETTVPPPALGVTAVMAVPLVSVNGLPV